MRALLAAALLLTAVVAGCFGGGDDDDGADPGAASSTGTSTAPTPSPILLLNVTIGDQTYRFTSEDLASSRPAALSSSGTVTVSSTNSTSGDATGNATGNATAGNQTATPTGPAPLNVTFELGASRLTNVSGLRWTLGNSPRSNETPEAPENSTENATWNATAKTGMTLPAVVEQTFNASGTYEVVYALRLGNGTPERLQVTIIVSNGTANVTAEKPLPDPATFEMGATAGCVSEVTCLSRELGPGGSGIDGHWIELTEAYWGFAFVVDGAFGGDSDCQALDADEADLGDFSNGAGACAGVLPDGAAWLFINSWAGPTTGMTLTFSHASEE